MKLIDGDRIVTAQLYDDQYEEFTEKKMSIIDYINAYTDEGVTEADVVEQLGWIPVSGRLPEAGKQYLCCDINGFREVGYLSKALGKWAFLDSEAFGEVIAWMPLPAPYMAESEE